MTQRQPCPPLRHRALLALALALALAGGLLAGCGGGGSSENPITVDRLAYGELSTFTVTGSNLTSGVSFTLQGCDGRVNLPGGSATQQQFSCRPNALFAVRVGVVANGSEFYRKVFEVPLSTAKVEGATPLTADRLRYGQTSTFTLAGTGLDTGVQLGVTGCDGLVQLADSNASQRRFSCTPNGALSVQVALVNGLAAVYQTSLPVPAPQVTMVTTGGTVVVELDPGKVKATVDNFLAYVASGFYNGTLFHRVISGFVAQGGGFTGVANGTLTAQAPLRAAIPLESNKGLNNLRGSIAMARATAVNSATSQFFFNAVDNAFLDYASAASPGYAVFGKVVSGQAVLDAMDGVPTRTVGSNGDVPVTDIVLQTASQTQ